MTHTRYCILNTITYFDFDNICLNSLKKLSKHKKLSIFVINFKKMSKIVFILI